MSVVAKLWDGLRASYTKLVVAELNNYGALPVHVHVSCCSS